MKAKDVMTTRIISTTPDVSVMQAASLMLKYRISGLPVTGDDGKVVGIVTEGDFLRRGEIGTQRRHSRWLEILIGPGRLATEYVNACGRKVREVMTPEVHTISQDTELSEAVRLMERHRIKRLPVVHDGKLVGILSRANVLHAVASLARGTNAAEVDAVKTNDAVIRTRLMTELDKQSWAPLALLNIIVSDGYVDLWGTITDEREREALIVAAENIPGVRGVRDHLVWIEPMSGMAVLPSEDEQIARTKANEKSPATTS